MPASHRVPGVYRESQPLPRPITLATGVPAILGYGRPAVVRARRDGAPDPMAPIALFRWSDFQSAVIDPDPLLAAAVQGFFQCGGAQCQVLLLHPVDAASPTGSEPADEAWQHALTVLESLETIDLVCAPSLMYGEPLDLEYIVARQLELLRLCETRGDLFAILDPVSGTNATTVSWQLEALRHSALRDGAAGLGRNGALYFPWLKANPGSLGGLLPPCGHLAGIYSATDNTAGVYKAPANEVLEDVVDLTLHLSDLDQSLLDPSINCLRIFPGAGIRVWGARTIADPALEREWTHVSVRRLFITVTRWLSSSTTWAVMEPITSTLQIRIVRQVSAYLTGLYTCGALKGAGPEESFYVKCDRENNTAATRAAGQLVVEIGLAPAVPAEFITIRLTQSAEGASVSLNA